MTFIPALFAASKTNHCAAMLVDPNGSSCWWAIVSSDAPNRSGAGRTSSSATPVRSTTMSIQCRSETASSGGT